MRHRWDISPARAIALQRKLSLQVLETPIEGRVCTVAGADCAFLDDGRRIVAAVVLLEARTMAPRETAFEVRPCAFPYVPGLLSFREAPAVIAAVEKLTTRPDLLLIDGQGRAHPRGLGLASHVGLWLDLPTIGAAKSRLCGEHRALGVRRGCQAALRLQGHTVGAVLRTRTNVKPLFVSVGHRITLDQAVRWTLRCCRGVRLPDPTRLAHQLVGRLKMELVVCP